MIKYTLKEIGPSTVNFQGPTKYKLNNASILSLFNWDFVTSYTQIEVQPFSLFNVKNWLFRHVSKLFICMSML